MLIVAPVFQILKRSLALCVLSAALASAVQPIKVQGADYVNSVTGDRFQIIGVAYVAVSGIHPKDTH